MALHCGAQIQDFVPPYFQGIVLVQMNIVDGQIPLQASQVALAISPICINYLFRTNQPGGIDVGILSDLDDTLPARSGCYVEQFIRTGQPGEMLAVIAGF